MKDWKKIASGNGLNIPEADIDRIVPALNALEAAFRPLAADVAGAIEPAVTFRPEEKGE